MPRIKTLRAMVRQFTPFLDTSVSVLQHTSSCLTLTLLPFWKIYAGAPMNKQIGDRLAAEDIALIPFYGTYV